MGNALMMIIVMVSPGMRSSLPLCVSGYRFAYSQSGRKRDLIVMGYETSKLITSDTDLERGNAQRERRKIATTC